MKIPLQIGIKRAIMTIDFTSYLIPEFCKGLCKKCPENRMNSGVQGISEMYKTVVFFLVF